MDFVLHPVEVSHRFEPDERRNRLGRTLPSVQLEQLVRRATRGGHHPSPVSAVARKLGPRMRAHDNAGSVLLRAEVTHKGQGAGDGRTTGVIANGTCNRPARPQPPLYPAFTVGRPGPAENPQG